MIEILQHSFERNLESIISSKTIPVILNDNSSEFSRLRSLLLVVISHNIYQQQE